MARGRSLTSFSSHQIIVLHPKFKSLKMYLATALSLFLCLCFYTFRLCHVIKTLEDCNLVITGYFVCLGKIFTDQSCRFPFLMSPSAPTPTLSTLFQFHRPFKDSKKFSTLRTHSLTWRGGRTREG